MRSKTDLLKMFEKQNQKETLVGKIQDIQGLIKPSDLLDTRKWNLPFNNLETLSSLKKYRLACKNYLNIYASKAKVLGDILACILHHYSERLNILLDFFRKFKRATRKNLEGVSISEKEMILINQMKTFVGELEMEVTNRRGELKEMLDMLGCFIEKGPKQGYLAVSLSNLQLFLNSISLMIHKIEKEKANGHQLAFVFSNAEGNTALLELLTLISCEAFRKFALEVVIVKIFDLHKKVTERIDQGKTIAEQLSAWHPKSFEQFHFKDLKIRLSSLIEPSLKRYVKHKIGLKPEIIIKDEDLEEFFQEKFIFKYPSSSPLWAASANVSFENPRTKELIPVMLLLDVK